MNYNFGIIGLGVMGRSLALNIERHGFSVITYDLSTEQQKSARIIFSGKNIVVAANIEELFRNLIRPRSGLIMVPAGRAVDAVIEQSVNFLEEGDILIDGGNSHYSDTTRRLNSLNQAGIYFIGAGISGGEEGALWGPSIMPGGNVKGWPYVKNILQSIAAKADDGLPCCDWIGDGGSGHFVKMVHNGIEYADMQLIGEAYFLMKHLTGLTAPEMAEIFREWDGGDLNGYLIEITAEILNKKDPQTGRPIVDIILDTAEQKGTGKWTSVAALDLGIPAPTITESVFARIMSAYKEDRSDVSAILKGPNRTKVRDIKNYLDILREALYTAKICVYTQGFQILHAASGEFGWRLNLRQIASLWRAGCIIRAQLLDRIMAVYETKPELKNLMLSEYFSIVLGKSQEALRKICVSAVENGIAVPALSSTLSYFDSYRSEFLPANLLQAQRDYFGAHTYERIDQPRGKFFHTQWREK